MTYVTCPVCALNVPVVRSDGAATIEDCPRCLARTSGAVSVKLERRHSPDERSTRRRVASLLRELRLTGVSR